MDKSAKEMWLRTIDPTYLDDEELEYELDIRHIVGLGNRRDKAKALRGLLTAESKGIQTAPEVSNRNDADEARICLIKAQTFEAEMAKALKDDAAIERMGSRLRALINRVDRIKDRSTKGVSECLQSIDMILGYFESNLGGSKEGQSSTGAIPKVTQSQVNTNGNARNSVNLLGRASWPPTSGSTTTTARGRGISMGPRQESPIPNRAADPWEQLSPQRNLGGQVSSLFPTTSQGAGRLGQVNGPKLPARPERNFQQRHLVDFVESESEGEPQRSDSQSPGRVNWFQNGDKNIPVHKWRISFSGDGTGISASKFLNYVEMYADNEGVSRAKLLKGIHHLLKGKAGDWYLANYTRFESWYQFRRAYENQFLPTNYDFVLLDQIRQRVQSKNESISSFISDLKNLFQSMRDPIPPRQQVHIARSNVLPEYGLHLASPEIDDLDKLAAKCKGFDEHTRLMQQRPSNNAINYGHLLEPSYFPKPTFSTGPPKIFRKEVNEIHSETQGVKDTIKEEIPSHSAHNIASTASNHASQSFPMQYSHPMPYMYGYMPPSPWYGHPQISAMQAYQPHTYPPCSYPYMGLPPQMNVEAVTKGDKTNPSICWRCDSPAHRWRECKVTNGRIFCHYCGKLGFTTASCPNNHDMKRRFANLNTPKVSMIQGNSSREESEEGVPPPPQFL